MAVRSLAVPPSAEITAELREDAAAAAEFLRRARSDNTRRAHRSDWRQFAAWIESHGLAALPADPRMVALWLSHLGRLGRRPSTIGRMLATINVAHDRAGLPKPGKHAVVREELDGIRRALGVRQRRAAPLLDDHLTTMVARMGSRLRDVRDRAILLVGWQGALRRSELSALRLEHVAFVPRGATLLIERSKTDVEGEGAVVALFYGRRADLCPVRALQAWIQAARLADGHVFRPLSPHRDAQVLPGPIGGDRVREIVRRWAKKAGVQGELAGQPFTAHSLRAGLITQAARAGKPEWQIARQSRHRSADVLRGYIRVADPHADNAAEGLL